MVKRLISCTLMSCLSLFYVLPQDVKTVQDDSLRYIGSHNLFADPLNQKFEKRLTGYAGIATTGSRSAYYGGLTYALKDNVSLRFDMLYGVPQLYSDTRIVAPSLLFEYTIIGESDNHSSFGYNSGSPGFSLYGFTGIGSQMFLPGNRMITGDTHLHSPGSKTYNILLPLGLGLKYKFDNNMTIGLEIRGNFQIFNGGFYDPYPYGLNSYSSSLGQWGYPGVMYRQFRNGPGF